MRIMERQNEIIKILRRLKTETVPRLAQKLGVSKNTVYRDIQQLSLVHTIVTRQGNGGGVTLLDWKEKPYKNILNLEQQQLLVEFLDIANERQKKILVSILEIFDIVFKD